MKRKIKKMPLGNYVLGSLLNISIIPAVFLGAAGTWHWPEGWAFSLWFDGMIMSNSIYLYLKDPALLAERTKLPGSDNQKRWDKYLMGVIIIMFFAWFIGMPLDAKRFAWSPAFPIGLKLLGGVALLPALYFIQMATVENTFLSTMVRIQKDRKQRVISTGVYSFVRHPLYLGCSLMLLGAPLLLGSQYGFVLAGISFFVLAGRIMGEEKMLAHELRGYRDYQKKVRYRLIPFVW